MTVSILVAELEWPVILLCAVQLYSPLSAGLSEYILYFRPIPTLEPLKNQLMLLEGQEEASQERVTLDPVARMDGPDIVTL